MNKEKNNNINCVILETKYLLANRIFMSSLFDQGLRGGLVLG